MNRRLVREEVWKSSLYNDGANQSSSDDKDRKCQERIRWRWWHRQL